ncbi:hypothetical protein CPJCM30710_03360 [Clostridium polyendosporum]|uniref:Uncharacterized protein n=1 Tax=Clostridium polyendosporum TaxID=69208 RepID=A0A919RY97_9CLOT|nr:protein kinase [Clostridium polyendosporum]GIM27670.1 hypothetical protein CPJCM30710_03360 [Clostridium polyendosporum]
MVRHLDFSTNFSDELEKLFKKAEFLGEGHNGIVYLLPENKIIKFFRDKEICADEYYILYKAQGSIFFPKVYEYGEYYIVRDYVGGIRLDKYVERKGLDSYLCKALVEMLDEFTKLGFTKIDIRCRDIYVQDNKSIIVIDPKNNFDKKVKYPRHLMKGLNKLGVLQIFLSYIKEKDKSKYGAWKYSMEKYLKYRVK